MEHFLQQDTFPIVIFVAECGTDALQNKLCGTIQGNGQLSPCIKEPVMTLVNVSPVPDSGQAGRGRLLSNSGCSNGYRRILKSFVGRLVPEYW